MKVAFLWREGADFDTHCTWGVCSCRRDLSPGQDPCLAMSPSDLLCRGQDLRILDLCKEASRQGATEQTAGNFSYHFSCTTLCSCSNPTLVLPRLSFKGVLALFLLSKEVPL